MADAVDYRGHFGGWLWWCGHSVVSGVVNGVQMFECREECL